MPQLDIPARPPTFLLRRKRESPDHPETRLGKTCFRCHQYITIGGGNRTRFFGKLRGRETASGGQGTGASAGSGGGGETGASSLRGVILPLATAIQRATAIKRSSITQTMTNRAKAMLR